MPSPFQASGTINSEVVVFRPDDAGLLEVVVSPDHELVMMHLRNVVSRHKIPLKYYVANGTVQAWVSEELDRPRTGGARPGAPRTNRDPSQMMQDPLGRDAVLRAARVARSVSDDLKACAGDEEISAALARRVRAVDWASVGGRGLVAGHP